MFRSAVPSHPVSSSYSTARVCVCVVAAVPSRILIISCSVFVFVFVIPSRPSRPVPSFPVPSRILIIFPPRPSVQLVCVQDNTNTNTNTRRDGLSVCCDGGLNGSTVVRTPTRIRYQNISRSPPSSFSVWVIVVLFFRRAVCY